jgi:hypothetical protein
MATRISQLRQGNHWVMRRHRLLLLLPLHTLTNLPKLLNDHLIEDEASMRITRRWHSILPTDPIRSCIGFALLCWRLAFSASLTWI